MTLVVIARPTARLGAVLALLRPARLALLVEADPGPPREWDAVRRGLLGRSERGARHRETLDTGLRAAAEDTCGARAAEATAAGFDVVLAGLLEPGPHALDAATADLAPTLIAVCGWPGPPPPHIRRVPERHGVPLLDAPDPQRTPPKPPGGRRPSPR